MPDGFLHVPPAWDAAAQHVHRHALRRVLVVGEKDTDKSTFCRFLAEAATRLGRSTALLDTDVGQKLVGPPACVTMDDRQGLSLAFVGSTNPVLGWSRLVEGTRRLAQQTEADCLIVNTSGLLAGPGRSLKAAKIDALRPDLLIAVGEGQSLGAIAPDASVLPSLCFTGSTTQDRWRAAHGPAGGLPAVFLAIRCAEARIRSAPAVSRRGSSPTRLLVGLSDEPGHDLGLGLLLNRAEGEILEVLSPVVVDGVLWVQPGLLILGEDFTEQHLPADRRRMSR